MTRYYEILLSSDSVRSKVVHEITGDMTFEIQSYLWFGGMGHYFVLHDRKLITLDRAPFSKWIPHKLITLRRGKRWSFCFPNFAFNYLLMKRDVIDSNKLFERSGDGNRVYF
ncbi:hypothetical protein NPIL_455031 [Nephila pilipes]|uniref:Uncharacterized protein n=1 Tax=Nephila pilipes TaxID=299642 RepID=A0A8X6UI60_NEPPI|nr:hypothetical protein NPIL_455031 [Nephila pilipes]